MILVPLDKRNRERPVEQELNILLQKGYSRLWWKGEIRRIEDLLENEQTLADMDLKTHAFVLMDRFALPMSEESDWMRLADSVNTAFYESEGECAIQLAGNDGGESPAAVVFNNRFELDGIVFPEPTPQLFNYNNPYGACPTCEGYGRVLGIDPDKVIPDKTKSVYDGAVACWKGEKYGEWLSFSTARTYGQFSCTHTVRTLSKGERNCSGTAKMMCRYYELFSMNWKARRIKYRTG
jgi:excinuclease ABC subunit A